MTLDSFATRVPRRGVLEQTSGTLPRLILIAILLPVASSLPACSSSTDLRTFCTSDADCPPGFRCENQVCVRIEAGSPGARTFTAGGASLSSENYRFELFISPVCPTGDLQSQNHRLKLGPAAYAARDP